MEPVWLLAAALRRTFAGSPAVLSDGVRTLAFIAYNAASAAASRVSTVSPSFG